MVVISFILITFSLDQVLILWKNWIFMTLQTKGKRQKTQQENSLSIYDLESLNCIITKANSIKMNNEGVIVLSFFQGSILGSPYGQSIQVVHLRVHQGSPFESPLEQSIWQSIWGSPWTGGQRNVSTRCQLVFRCYKGIFVYLSFFQTQQNFLITPNGPSPPKPELCKNLFTNPDFEAI